MKQSVVLNGKKTILEANPETQLSVILRTQKLFSVKTGGERGESSFCTILLNDKPVPSDIIPFATIRNMDIKTLEYFKQTEDYQDIEKGFSQAGIRLCGYCDADKIFTAWDIIKKMVRPTVEEIEIEISNMSFCCTNKKTFISGIRNASMLRNKRLFGNKHLIGNKRNGRN